MSLRAFTFIVDKHTAVQLPTSQTLKYKQFDQCQRRIMTKPSSQTCVSSSLVLSPRFREAIWKCREIEPPTSYHHIILLKLHEHARVRSTEHPAF